MSSVDIIAYAFRAIRVTAEKSLTYELHSSPDGIKVLAFNCRPDYTTRFVNAEFDLVSSQSCNVLDFILTKVNLSFSINIAAVELFKNLRNNMKELEDMDLKKPLVVTGRGLGGYLAILYTLWLQNSIYERNTRDIKRPFCITFGSPLIGDEDFRHIISEHLQCESCFLNVVSMTDYIGCFFSANDLYKPFGSFFFCTESGGHATFEDQEVIIAVLDSMAHPRSRVRNFEEHDYMNNLSSIRKKNLFRRRVLESSKFNVNLLTEGIRLQFKEIGVLDKISNDLIKKMELKQEKMIESKREKNTYDLTKTFSEMRLSMTFMEWYIVTRQSRGGYYDCYKKLQTEEENKGHIMIMTYRRFMNTYWKKFVKERDENPQREGAKFIFRWLYSGNKYRLMFEPLDIAEYYQRGEKNYIQNRPNHYKLLETWFDENQNNFSDASIKKAPPFNQDSCFWAHVEEALIALKDLKLYGRLSKNGDAGEHKLEQFLGYIMCAINDYAVSSDVFLEGSSLRNWWSEYDTYKNGSCTSKFAQYMNSGRYKEYQ